MDVQELQKTAQAIVADGKGILAADESDGTIKKRFDSIGVESNEEARRGYRDLLFTTEGAEEYIGGVILFDETIRQSALDGTQQSRCGVGQQLAEAQEDLHHLAEDPVLIDKAKDFAEDHEDELKETAGDVKDKVFRQAVTAAGICARRAGSIAFTASSRNIFTVSREYSARLLPRSFW